MKGGCFSKILTFVFGLIIGFVLLAGTLAGGVYFLVTGVTINDVENIAKTDFPFIDKEAEIRDKSLIDIINLVMNNNFQKITVQEVKTTFGIDVPDIIEKTLDIKINEENRNKINDLPILQVFQGDNLKTVLNCVTLKDVLTKAGISTAEGELTGKPIVKEHYAEPVVDAFNAILADLNFDKLKIGELEYLIGINLGGGILDSVRDKTLNDLGVSINEITLENIIPDFDRDTYIKLDDTPFYLSGYNQVRWDKAYVEIGAGDTLPEGTQRYTLDEKTGTVKKDDNGKYRLKDEYKDLHFYEDCYASDGTNYTQNRHGFYIPVDEDGNLVKASDRFIKINETTYTKDKNGLYYQSFTTIPNGTDKYHYSYVKNFIKVEGEPVTFTLEKRGLVKVSDYTDGYFKIETTSKDVDGVTIYTNNLVETTEADGVFALKRGTSENILQAFADMTLQTINEKIGDVTIGDIIKIDDESPEILKALKNSSLNSLPDDVKTLKLGQIIKIDETSPEILKALQDSTLDSISNDVNNLKLSQIIKIDETSPKILQALKNSSLNTLSTDIQNVKIKEIIDIVPECVVVENPLGDYVAIKGDIRNYVGCYKVGKIEGDNTPLYLVKRQDGLDETYFTTTRYNITTKASSGILKSLGELTVGGMQSNLQGIIDDSKLGDVLEIDGDVFVKTTYTNYAGVPAGEKDNHYVYVDENNDIMRNIENTDNNATIYKRIYVGTDHALMKKMYNIKINNIASRIKTIIDETKFNEIININPYYIIEVATGGDYIALPDGEYFGTYKEGRLANDSTIIKFVKYKEGLAFSGTRYNIITEQSSGALIKLNDSKIGKLTDGSQGLQSVIESCKLSDVLDIDGNVYVKLNATNFEAAKTEAGAGDVYYRDSNKGNLFYIADTSTATFEFYKLFYSGGSSVIIKRLADLAIEDLGKGQTLNDIVNDCTISDLGITTSEGSLLNELANTRISDLDSKVQDMLNTSTMADLNSWGNLGLTPTQLNTVCGDKTVGEMTIKDFIVAAITIIQGLPHP